MKKAFLAILTVLSILLAGAPAITILLGLSAISLQISNTTTCKKWKIYGRFIRLTLIWPVPAAKKLF